MIAMTGGSATNLCRNNILTFAALGVLRAPRAGYNHQFLAISIQKLTTSLPDPASRKYCDNLPQHLFSWPHHIFLPHCNISIHIVAQMAYPLLKAIGQCRKHGTQQFSSLRRSKRLYIFFEFSHCFWL
jgi:hypothetical protein